MLSETVSTGDSNLDLRIPKSNQHNTHSSPFKNSAVRKRCSRDRVADKTPPYNSVSLTVFRADPDSVDYKSILAHVSLPNHPPIPPPILRQALNQDPP